MAEIPLGDVKPGHLAARLAQRHDTIEAADKADIQFRAVAGAQQVPQFRQNEVVAGINRDRRLRLVQQAAELLLDLRGRTFEMRRQSRLDPFAQPQEALAERGQPAAAALFFVDQRLADDVRPFRNQTPGLAIGEPHLGRGAGQLAALPDCFEQLEELRLDRFSRLHAGAPHQIEM